MKTRTNFRYTSRRSLQRVLITLVTGIIILWPYMFSIASTETTFTLINGTKYFLHASIADETFAYIAPGGSVMVEVAAPINVFAKVRYSPGQDVKGKGEKMVEIDEKVAMPGGTCTNDTEGTSTCTTDPDAAKATPATWSVLPTDLTAE